MQKFFGRTLLIRQPAEVGGASPINISEEPTAVAVNGMHNGQELLFSQAIV